MVLKKLLVWIVVTVNFIIVNMLINKIFIYKDNL